MDLELDVTATEILVARMDTEDHLRRAQERAVRDVQKAQEEITKAQRKQAKFQRLRNANKEQLAASLSRVTGFSIPPNANFGIKTNGSGIVGGLPEPAPKPADPPAEPPKGDSAGAAGAIDASKQPERLEKALATITPMPVGAVNGEAHDH